MILSMDFETRSLVDLPDCGLDVYSSHPSTQIICLAAGYHERTVSVWAPEDVPEWVLDHVRSGGKVSAWNAGFEIHIWNRVGAKLGWPELKLSQVVDSMAIAAANNLPQDLDTAGEVLGTEFQKDKRGKKLIQLLSKPDKNGKFNMDPGLLKEMFDYCRRDVQTEMSIIKGLRPLSPDEQAIWELTQRINARGVGVDPEELKRIVAVVGKELSVINAEIEALTGGIQVTKREQLLKWFREHGLNLPDMQAETIERAATQEHDDPAVARVLKLRAEGAKTSVSKFAKMLDMQVDGRIRNSLVYHGASTGRWASRGINLQNIARPAVWMKDEDIAEAAELALVKGDYEALRDRFESRTMEACASIVRNALKAPDGFLYVDADLSSIENRVAAWVAHQDDKLELFRQGLDEYKVFASTSLYNVPYEEVTKDMRQVSKSGLLGSMFGQGAKGLVAYAEGMGVFLTLEQAEHAVQAYRQDYSKVKNCWYAMGQAAIDAIKNPGTAFRAGRVLLKVSKGALWMQLPSGRLICWQKPEVRKELTPWGKMAEMVYVFGQNTFTRKWGMNKLIGSSIFQSSVQGIARDFLAEPTLRLDRAGVLIVNLVHDEILALAEIERAKEVEQLILKEMTTPPAWAPNFPLAAESWVDLRYRK